MHSTCLKKGKCLSRNFRSRSVRSPGLGRIAELTGSRVEFWRSGVEVVELGRKYHRWPPDFDSPLLEYGFGNHQLIQEHMSDEAKLSM